MIVLPIGHEESEVRRLPWVTFVVMGLCVIAFLMSGRATLIAHEDVELYEDQYEAIEFYLQHPYLELAADFREQLFGDERALAGVVEVYGDPQPAPATTHGRELEQQQLDRLTLRAMTRLDSHPLHRWGLVPNRVRPIALISHIFLHAGWLHLLGNLLILYLAGPFIEDVWGRPLYLTFYLVSGLLAGLAHVVFTPGSGAPLVGASGAIAGVMGAFLVRYRTTRIRFFYLIGIFARGTFSAPAWLMLPFWFCAQLFLALLTQGQGGSGVAYWAHVGGFVVGVVAALAIQAFRIEERYIHSVIEDKIHKTLLDNSTLENAMEAVGAGDDESAFQQLLRCSRNEPTNPDTTDALWEVARRIERRVEAAPSILRAIKAELLAGEAESALRHWAELLREMPEVQPETGLALKLAQELAERGRFEEARSTLRIATLSGGPRMSAAQAIRIMRMARGIDPQIARVAAQRALEQPDLDPELRARTERLLAEIELSSLQKV